MWVKEALKRADKTEYRHWYELQVDDRDYLRNPYSDFDRFQRDIALIPDTRVGGASMKISRETVPVEYRPARILLVGGRKAQGT
jgi:hypothetical protein